MQRRIKILLVEDDPDDVWVMRNLLGDRWDEPFDLVQVELLSAAIERCAEDAFDVILLDLTLPDSQGLETFFAMHAHAGQVPIVILSGHDDQTSAVKAVQTGAQDYIVKGQVTDQVLVRSIRYAIERGRRHRAEEALRDTSEEFRAAGEIQQRLYPGEPPSLPGFEIAGALFPTKATAGDYFDYIPMLDGCLGDRPGRREQPRHGAGPVDVGDAGLPPHAGPDARRRGRNPHPRQPPAGRRRRRFPLRHPGAWPGSIPAGARWSTPARASGATCSTPAWT